MDYLEWVEDCDEVYIRLSQQISFSDTRLVDQVIAGLGGRKVIVRDLPDEPGLRSYILETLSSATFEIEP